MVRGDKNVLLGFCDVHGFGNTQSSDNRAGGVCLYEIVPLAIHNRDRRSGGS